MGHYGEAYPAEGEVGLLRLEGGAALRAELHEARHGLLAASPEVGGGRMDGRR